MELDGAMHDSRVMQHYIVDMISDMYDGPENVPITTQDLKNMQDMCISFVIFTLLY